MGFIGKWGEHHSPSIPPDLQKLMGDTFNKAFGSKLVMIRHPWDFQDYEFGIYWDSWAHIQQMDSHGKRMAELGDRWQTMPMGGEAAYNWGKYKEQPGESPTDTVRDPKHRDFFINAIRWLHCNHIGWTANYDHDDAEARKGAEQVQKALGYRFVIDAVCYPSQIAPGETLQVSLSVRNTGSSPLYYNWPVEAALLEPDTRKAIWKDVFRDLDIRTWLPGDNWNNSSRIYDIPPGSYSVEGSFRLPDSLPPGEYVLSLAILDPAGMLPAARFAIRNYYNGGRHPIGRIGVGSVLEEVEIDENEFDDPAKDRSLHYIVGK